MAAIEQIRRIICSNPRIISMMYTIIKFCERVANLPAHTTTVIGGSAFLIHGYYLSELNMERMIDSMQDIPLTSDIDIALWYDTIMDAGAFRTTNEHLADTLHTKIQEDDINTLIKEEIERTLGYQIGTFVMTVPAPKTFQNMTTTIHINFVINGQSFTAVDLAIKNPIYSQRVPPQQNRATMNVKTNIMYTNKENTVLRKIYRRNPNDPNDKSESVRVPTIQRLIEQQQFALDNVRDRTPQNLHKYRARIEYLSMVPVHTNVQGGRRKTRSKKNKRTRKRSTR